MEDSIETFKNIKNRIKYVIQLSRAWVIIKTTKTLTQNDVQTFMFTAALFAMAKIWRHTKFLSKYSHAVLPSHKNEEILLFVIT